MPLSRSGADSIRFTSNPQTLGSYTPALIPSLSAGGEGPRLKLCSHQDQTGTVPSLLTAQIKGRVYLQAPAQRHSSWDSHTQFQKELGRKSRTCTYSPSLPHQAPLYNWIYSLVNRPGMCWVTTVHLWWAYNGPQDMSLLAKWYFPIFSRTSGLVSPSCGREAGCLP